ncbi:MAG TPA: disulfide reductase, partial [Desulfotomaculum sp.]|nr:disulfide reductase [Desulfotomaculum sp.]
MQRIGVFVCWCGSNIGAVVDVPRVVKEVSTFPRVVYATDYKYMCSEPGQETIIQAVKEHRLDRVVVASCSPRP